MLAFLVLEFIAVLIGVTAIMLAVIWSGVGRRGVRALRALPARAWGVIALLILGGALFIYAIYPYPLNFALPPMMRSLAPGGIPASIPIPKVFTFFSQLNRFEKVGSGIGADPNAVPKRALPDSDGIVRLALTAKEVIGEVGKGIHFNYWTYNGTVPGPMLRVREGDAVEISLTNDSASLHPHNIDLHAVTGPGGGAAVTRVQPGETKTFRWKALNPGLYVYHCATPNISTHNAHGQYGLILVEPKEGFSEVDKEFYVMQGELYTGGGLGRRGLVAFDPKGLLDGIPTYVTFNGILEEAPRMKAKVGDRVRMYVGNGGVNLISAFHIIGEIFDTVYSEAALGSPPLKNIQTTAVLPGGASIVEFTLEVPGNYMLVDHALARMNKGAWAILEVEGEDAPSVFRAVE